MTLFQRLFELFGKPQWSLIEAHQASTHISLSLLLGAVGFDVAALLFPRKRATWRESAFWMQLAGMALLLVTFGLGFYGNPFAGKSNDIAQRVEWHKNFGYVALGTFALLSSWRIARHRRWGRFGGGAFALVNGFGLLVLTLTGWMGGHLIGDMKRLVRVIFSLGRGRRRRAGACGECG